MKPESSQHTAAQLDVPRQSFGLEVLDRHLGGGLIPGTLTVIAGATGAGKTQLGLRWAARGANEEGYRGVVLDLTGRGDPQNHEAYAAAQYGWTMRAEALDGALDPSRLWEEGPGRPEILRPFAGAGRRVTRPDLAPNEWDAWKRDLARVLRHGASFAYRHLAHGVRRVVVDGVEPAERPTDSIQLEFFEYLYERVLRQDDEWAAREVLREAYRAHEARVLAQPYDHAAVGCLLLYTAPQVLLDDLLESPIGQGNLFATANTVIALGRIRSEVQFGRALCVVKHRGSYCSDQIVPFAIGARGVEFS